MHGLERHWTGLLGTRGGLANQRDDKERNEGQANGFRHIGGSSFILGPKGFFTRRSQAFLVRK